VTDNDPPKIVLAVPKYTAATALLAELVFNISLPGCPATPVVVMLTDPPLAVFPHPLFPALPLATHPSIRFGCLAQGVINGIVAPPSSSSLPLSFFA